MKGGAEEGVEEEGSGGTRTINRRATGTCRVGFGGGGIDTPLFPLEGRDEVDGCRHCGNRGICLRKTIILGDGWVCLV